MHCLCCGRPIHAECLKEWMQSVCPSKAGLFSEERDAVLCANCLWRRWPTAMILYHLEKLDDTAVRLLVLPEGAKEVWPESPTRSATYEMFAEQYKRGTVLGGVLTILPDRPAPGQSTPARGMRRGPGGPQGRGRGGRAVHADLSSQIWARVTRTTPRGNTPQSLVALSLRPERPRLISCRKWPGCGANWSGVSWSFS